MHRSCLGYREAVTFLSRNEYQNVSSPHHQQTDRGPERFRILRDKTNFQDADVWRHGSWSNGRSQYNRKPNSFTPES